MDTETVAKAGASAIGFTFFALIEKPGPADTILLHTVIDGVSIQPWTTKEKLKIDYAKTNISAEGEVTLSARRHAAPGEKVTSESIKEKMMQGIRQGAIEQALKEAKVRERIIIEREAQLKAGRRDRGIGESEGAEEPGRQKGASNEGSSSSRGNLRGRE